jgi:putative GTP pyrophosphokinase
MTTDRDYRDWIDIFEAQRSRFERFTRSLEHLIPEILTRDGMVFDHIEARTKETRSLREKLDRKGHRYEDLLRDVHDLSALRVVVFYPQDVEDVVAILEKTFQIFPEHSGPKRAELGHDQFGYLSHHLVATLRSDRTDLPEWRDFNQLRAEIQVRTVAEHAWASIQRRLDYKAEGDIPRSLRRQLFRLSALFELADDEFERLRVSNEALKITYADKVESGDLSELWLDADSLGAYLADSQALTTWGSVLVDAGFALADSTSDEWPARSALDRSDLLRAASLTGVATLADLDELLSSADVWGPRALRHVALSWSSHHRSDRPLETTPEGALTMLILCHAKVDRTVAGTIYGPTVSQAIADFDPGSDSHDD